MTEKTFDQPKPGAVLAENVSFEEFVKLFEGQAVEWHAGKVIVKVSNNEKHHVILGFLHILFATYLSLKPLGKVYLDGYQMYVGDDKPARQPDLLVVLEEHYDRIKHQHLDGVADVAVEIISPGSGSTDRGEKFDEYENEGIPEYWLIDPIRQQADVYILDEKGHYQRQKADDGKLVSNILPRLVLDAKILWQDELPNVIEITKFVQKMLEI